jgi:two-component system, chemotaxis family, sensor kinase CheA
VSIDKIDTIMSLFEEFIVEKARLSSISQGLKDSELDNSLERIGRYSSEMQNAVLSMRMLPIDSVFNRFPRMVRNLSKELNKEIDLVITGSDTELDRMMIDELGDPLVHLIRNSIDHGIERSDERKRKGKTPAGIIKLAAFHKGNQAVIQITDDGNGIDPDRIKEKAIKNGVLTEEEAGKMNHQQIVQHIFASGFSTAEKVTDLSGRGVGLDVVKNKIEALGGNVTVETAKGTGSVFTITLPLTLSIVQALVVKSGDQKVVIPLSNIVETAYIKEADIKLLSNEPIVHFRGEVIPVKSVTDLFGADFSTQVMQGVNPTIIVSVGEKMFALVVTELVGQQEIVLKNLDGLLQEVKNVSGATILGDGSIAFVIDCNALLK